MKPKRKIRRILPAQKVNMGGQWVFQPLPTAGIEQIDPFLLIHHWQDTLPGGHRPQEVGVGPHPHRGFSPVTFVYKGDLQHRDSLGHNAIVGPGGTQWMHAGRGITHSERPSRALADQGGETEFIQFWINTPARHKMEIPTYLPLASEDTPSVHISDCEIAVVAGSFAGVQGPASIYSPMTLLRITAHAGADLELELSSGFHTLVYILDGQVKSDDQLISGKNLAWYSDDGTVDLSFEKDTRCIVLAGQPIGEKVSKYGPFVMNTQTEIMEAIRDAQMGKMGILIEEF